MRAAAGRWSCLTLLLAVAAAPCAAAAPQEQPAALSLTGSQQQAVGIRIEHPLPLTSATAVGAYGTVLDPAALAGDLGRVQSTRAAATAAAAEAARLERLYRDDAQASLRAWQSAQAQSVEAAAQARAAAMSFALQWGPLAGWSAARQHVLLEALGARRQLLLRADVPGHGLGGALDARALVEVDGVQVAARVLGALPRTDAQSQSAGWLLELEGAPPGFGPGARAVVRLRSAATTAGLLVPAAALLYAEQGAYVYRLTASGTDTFRYAAVTVKPLARVGSAWLVDGLTRADQIVVQGAGVLWSLQGIGSFSAAEEEHD
ncbi:MAG TPA: hypothetical protein VED45_12615 [Steroidobacteraceae bacterium]|nr:hypothetical protein [Steroidobacteraceae bacterium]